jgi:hypothetical protein
MQLPIGQALLPLPGGGAGGPVVTSNNPEIFQGNGLLFGTGHPSPTRGGMTFPLTGDFGVYLHHINQSGAGKTVTLLVTNPNNAPITVSAEGSGYNQTETGGLGLGMSPDYVVSKDWISHSPTTVVAPTSLPSLKPLAIWQKHVNPNAEVDGRFAIHTTGNAYVYVVVTDGTGLNEAVSASQVDAPGIIAKSGNPPPPYGREAGVYSKDTWLADIPIDVPAPDHHLGFCVNTATGLGYPDIQAFPALMHASDSAAEAVGMYGNVYDLTVTLRHDGKDTKPRNVSVIFASLVTDNISRYWDGAGVVDGSPIVITQVPAAPKTLLKEITLDVGQTKKVRFQAMVPGLTSIPQALFLVSHG